MVKKICRLCFKKATKPISIFGAKGINLNIAEILRIHFPDEVNENHDVLPIFICADCWIKLKQFHEFYNAVAEAKSIYLMSMVKTEPPSFVEANYDYDLPSMKVEPIIDEDTSIIGLTDNGFDTEKESPENYSVECGADDHLNSVEASNDGNDDKLKCEDKLRDLPRIFTSKCDSIEGGGILCAKDATELAKNIYEKTSSKSAKNMFMKLIPNYYDMKCELCNYEFKSLNQAYAHYRFKHENAKIKLKCCPQRILSSDLRDHILYHMNPDLYICNECGKKFALGRQYRLHVQTHLPQFMECDICKKKFTRKKGIIKHMVTVHGRNKGRFECEHCKKRFNAKQTMTVHVRIHHQHIRHVCDVCAKEYRTLSGLLTHLRSHTDAGPRIKCKMCGNLFLNMYRLRLHQAKDHETATLLQCPHCAKKKTNLFQLKKHIAHSHNYRVHKCNLCEREFRSPVEVSRHMNIHIRGELFRCDYCPKQYSQQRDTTKHMKTAHTVEWNAVQKQQLMAN